MAQGEFTKQETQETREAVNEMFEAIPKSKRVEYIGHLNDVLLYLNAAGEAEPDKPEQGVSTDSSAAVSNIVPQ